ncbi:MAG: diguanylate cyclase [Burkholderiaceae bacterium]|nr:MAG: diguanylate cyclase [Burkholderiaceae bacterium]
MQILIVDDSPTSRVALTKSIERMGHRPIVAEGGMQAIELYRKESPGLVLLDVMMPDIDGYTVARKIRALQVDEWVPIIFLSAKDDDQDLERGIEAGGDDYLVKPVSHIVLSAKIRAMQRIDDMRQKLLYLSRQLAVANRELERISHQDGLTGLANRRYFDFYLSQELMRAKRSNTVLSVMMCDVDAFKPYNDNYGHLAGDETLRKVAKALTGICKRPGDLVARYGGEEFAFVMPDTPAEGAEQLALNILRAVSDLKIPHAFSAVAPYVTISVGYIACNPAQDITTDALLLQADEALYQAKQMGRNSAFAFAETKR